MSLKSDLNLVKEIEDGKKRIEETELSLKDTLLKLSNAIITPLNAIAGFAQSILEGSSEDINEDVTQIKTSSEKLLGVLNNILDIPDDDMQMYKLVFGSYNPEALLKQIVALAKERIKTDKVELNIMVDDNLPAFLFGDSIRIKEIVLNLLVNAIDHTKEGNINLDIGSLTIGNICRLTITVKDTGSGITQDKLETIFEPRVNTNKELAEGISELNLATIKNIVESMNGHISLESEYRDGTVVKIVIDQKIGIDPNAINQDDSIEECKRRVYLSKKVLIVDDDKINLKVASRLLMSYGVVTDEVSSGFQCIEKITGGEKYDLILLDDWMPQMGGVATLKQLKNIEGFNIPVVALTANAMAGMKDKYIKDGFDDFIPKPVERKELSRIMEKFLKEQ